MEVDCTSSASNESNPTHFHHQASLGQQQQQQSGFYADNSYFSASAIKRADYEYFSKDFYVVDRKLDEKDSMSSKGKDCSFLKSHKDFEALNNNNNNNSSSTNNNNNVIVGEKGGDLFVKKNFLYNGAFGNNLKKDYVDAAKSGVEYFGGSNSKKSENFIHLNNVDGFGKKPMGFSADQVRNYFFYA